MHQSLTAPWPTPIARVIYAQQCAQMATRMLAAGDLASAALNAWMAANYVQPK